LFFWAIFELLVQSCATCTLPSQSIQILLQNYCAIHSFKFLWRLDSRNT